MKKLIKLISTLTACTLLFTACGTATTQSADTNAQTSEAQETTTEAESTVEAGTLEINNTEWYVTDSGYLYCCYELYNPSNDTIVELPGVRVTARDASGGLLGTEDMLVMEIHPGERQMCGGMTCSVTETPATVDFEIIEPDSYDLKKASLSEEFVPLEVVNTNYQEGDFMDKIVGEIENKGTEDIKSAEVIIICHDANGNLVAVEKTYVDNVKAGTTTPFEDSLLISDVQIDSFDVYAYEWY